MAITDLTGTTWYVPSGWSATAGYGDYTINYEAERNNNGYVFAGSQLKIGYDASSARLDCMYYYPYNAYSNSTMSLLITFTGGTDVTNPSLIAWLSKYGELKTEPTPTEDITITLTYKGTPFLTITNGEITTPTISATSVEIPTKDYSFTENIKIEITKS